jgi:hydrogenase maturation protease
MGDDGLGVALVEMLRSRWSEEPGLSFLDGGTWGMQLMPDLEEADRLLLLDVIRSGRPPGTLVRLDRDQLPRHLHHKLSPHQIDLGEVLALLELRGTFPEDAVAMGIEPARVELGEGLSPVVAGAVPALIDAATEQLRCWGHRLTPVPATPGRDQRRSPWTGALHA